VAWSDYSLIPKSCMILWVSNFGGGKFVFLCCSPFSCLLTWNWNRFSRRTPMTPFASKHTVSLHSQQK
jgi:hypothetical protein